MISRAPLALLALVLALAACAETKYAGPDWRVTGEWRPANPVTADTDNDLAPRAWRGAGR